MEEARAAYSYLYLSLMKNIGKYSSLYLTHSIQLEKKNLMAYGRDEGEEINESWLVEDVGTTGLGSPRGLCWFFGFMNVESVWSRLECICKGSCQLSGF